MARGLYILQGENLTIANHADVTLALIRPGTTEALEIVRAVALCALLVQMREHWYAAGPNLVATLLSFVAISVAATALVSGFHRSRSMLAATLSSIADGVVATDREERVTFLNPVAEALDWMAARGSYGQALGAGLAGHSGRQPGTRRQRRPGCHPDADHRA